VPGVVAGPGVPLFREDGSVEDNPIFCWTALHMN